MHFQTITWKIQRRRKMHFQTTNQKIQRRRKLTKSHHPENLASRNAFSNHLPEKSNAGAKCNISPPGKSSVDASCIYKPPLGKSNADEKCIVKKLRTRSHVKNMYCRHGSKVFLILSKFEQYGKLNIICQDRIISSGRTVTRKTQRRRKVHFQTTYRTIQRWRKMQNPTTRKI